MNRIPLLILLVLATAPVCANDIAVSAPDGLSGWLLLEGPLGAATSEFAADPGMPAPDAMGWPHVPGKAADGTYPQTELWFMDAQGRYSQATHFLDTATGSYRRTLYSVFTLEGKPLVLHFDPFKKFGGVTQVLRVGDDAPRAGGILPAPAIVLNAADFLDAPVASPDGRHVAFRAFSFVDKRHVVTLRVYSTADWKLVAESAPRPFARPVWIDSKSLAVIAWEGESLPQATQRDGSLTVIRLLESHTPRPGKLVRAELDGSGLPLTTLLDGAFPPDQYTRTVATDPFGLGLIVARADGNEIVAEQREPKPDGKARALGRYEVWRGCSVGLWEVRCAGVRKVDGSRSFVLTRLERWNEVALPGALPRQIPGNAFTRIEDVPFRHISLDGHGGMISLGRGVAGMLEPLVNPDFDAAKPDAVQLLRHSLLIFGWRGCDTMRNPRVLQRVSKLVRRFVELGSVRTTLLAFDIKIAANAGKNEKSGRYIELYSAAGRKGSGAIRIEDNLSGSWLVQSIEGGGAPARDDYYSWAGEAPRAPPKMDSKKAVDAGKAYDDMVTQLEARKLLMLGGVEADWRDGGLIYLGRASYRDPASGATWRTWVYEKYGRVLDEQKYQAAEAALKAAQDAGQDTWARLRELKNLRERIEIRFVADLPIGSAGDWQFPHAIAQVKMRFALSNQQQAAVTELTFEPDKWVALPNLNDLGNKKPSRMDLLLPRVFRIYGRDEKGKLVEELKATAVDKGFDHPDSLVKGAKLTPGYDVPLAALGNAQFVNLRR